MDITTPGFGPYWASWSSANHDQRIPSRFTAQLETGWSVGGISVDSGGKPIEGASFRPGIEFKKRPGDHRQMRGGEQRKTDAAGKWHFDSVPVSMSEVFVEINHPRFKPVRRQLTRGEFGLEPGREPVVKVVMDHGLTVTGRVTDESGKPIVGALIRTKFLNDIREAHTGADGVYTLAGCEPRSARIVVSARGRATDMKELNIESEMQPVDFRMMPGGTVRIRALDEKGNPVPGARIFFQQWRGRFAYFEFNHISQFADKNGVWVWNEAPLDEFKADICPPDGMSLSEQPLIARPQEYVFRLPGPLVVSGKVIDAVTRKPIKEFRVVGGFRSRETEIHWTRTENYTATDGQYRIRETHGYFAHLVRIEADGYQAAVSRDIKSNEGIVSIDFELKKGMNIVAKVVTPRNLPAVGARVALGVAGSQINIKNGEFEPFSTLCAREAADETGRFDFPAQDENFQIVIIHPSGFAHIRSNPDWESIKIIHLEPWSRVEGTFRVGKKLAPNVPITLDVNRLDESGRVVGPRYSLHYETATGPDGRFVFDRVIPGKGWLGRHFTLTEDEGATEVTSSFTIAADFPAGKTAHIDLGGTGRAVVARLQPPEGSKQNVRWNFALVAVQSVPPLESGNVPRFVATVDRDGSFRIDDVPAGDYSLSVQFQRDAPGQLLDHRFKVSSQEGDLAAQPVDLGTLRLEKR